MRWRGQGGKGSGEREEVMASPIAGSGRRWRRAEVAAASLDLAMNAVRGRFGLGFGQKACARDGEDDGGVSEGVRGREGSVPRRMAAAGGRARRVATFGHPVFSFTHGEAEEEEETPTNSMN